MSGPDWRNIRGLGNILRHAYDHLDPRYIWDVLKTYLPELKAHVNAALIRPRKEELRTPENPQLP